MKRKLLLVFLLAVNSLLSAQNGTLEGVITEDTGESIPFANILLKGSGVGGVTDLDGKYSLSAPAGTYTVEMSFIGYDPVQVEGVEIKPGQTTKLNQTLKVSSAVLADAQVFAKADRETESALLLERKEATGIVQKIGAQELKRTGSSDVATGLTKVAGVSVQGGNMVMVRGMGDRYNAAYLNNLPIASPDPDRKVIPLDIFPTNIVSNLNIQKAYESSYYGDFSGGAINVNTKDYPVDPTLEISLGTGFNFQTISNNFLTYKGGSTDYLGFDDGTRALPDNLQNREFYNSNATGDENLFTDDFDATTVSAPINSSLGLTGGQYFKREEGGGFGFLVSMNHSNSSTYQPGFYRIATLQGDFLIDYEVNTYSINTSSSTLANLVYDLNSKNTIKANFLMVNLTEDVTRETFGINTDYDFTDAVFSRRLAFFDNRLWVGQLQGSHKLGDMELSWGGSWNKALSGERDRRQVVLFYDETSDSYLFNTQDVRDNHRFFTDLNEDEYNLKLQGDYHFYKEEGDEDPELTLFAGVDLKSKERVFDYWQYNINLDGVVSSDQNVDPNNVEQFINDENFANGSIFYNQTDGEASEYSATLNVLAPYFGAKWQFSPLNRIEGGVRFEYGDQVVNYRKQSQQSIQLSEEVARLDILPYVTFKRDLDENSALRASASKTIARPQYRELAPFEYTEFFAGAKSRGNPELINGDVYNLDVRYEAFPTPLDLFAVTLFGKYLSNPIEKIALSKGGGQTNSFINAENAVVAGVELEYVLSLKRYFKDVSVLKYLKAGANVSVMYNRVKLDANNTVPGQAGDGGDITVVSTSLERPMYGASPYLVNVDLSYDKFISEDKRLTMSLSYNIFGRRIFYGGTTTDPNDPDAGIGDAYEEPVNTLNLTASYEIKKFTLSAKLMNILNPEINIVQGTNAGDRTINSYQRGMGLSVGVSYNIF